MNKLIIICGIFLVLNAAVFAQKDIQTVDFKNFTYEASCAFEEAKKITVADGEVSEEKEVDGYTDRFFFKVFDTAYGDLDGDKKDEAIVLTVCNTGGTGNFTEGFIYGMNDGKPVLLARIPGGDRAYGGLREARVENGLLVVESNDVGEAGGACCPEFVVTSRYKVTDGKLAESGKSDRRELYPKERVKFPKGASGTIFKTTIPAQEVKRFTLGARAGQTLTVSLDSKSGSLRLLEDAEVKDEITKITAKLPNNGDYTFEVQNFEDKDLEITISVKIN
jgi:hypothetical protein